MELLEFCKFFEDFMEKETKRTDGNCTIPLFLELSKMKKSNEIRKTKSHLILANQFLKYGGKTEGNEESKEEKTEG